MNRTATRSRLTKLIAVLAFIVAAPTFVSAQTFTDARKPHKLPHPKATPTPTPSADGRTDWNGTTNSDFNTGSNWSAVSGSAPPIAGDVAWFTSAPANKIVNLSSSSSITGLYFNGTSSSGYDITSSGTAVKLTLTATGTAIGTELGDTNAVAIGAENTGGTNTIDAPIVLGAAAAATQTIFQASGGALVLNGVISEQNSGIKLSLSGPGTVTLNEANTYTGGTRVSAGTLNIGNDSALGTGTLTLTGGTIAATGGARTITNPVALPSSINVTFGGASDLTFSAGWTQTGNSGLTLNNTGTITVDGTFSIGGAVIVAGNGNIVFNAVIQGPSNAGFTFQGMGTITLNEVNTYSGSTSTGTAVTFVLGSKAPFGTGTVVTSHASFLATADLTGANAIGNLIFLEGNNTFTGSNNIEWKGIVNNDGDRTITNNITGALILSGGVNLSHNSTVHTLTLDGSGSTTINSAVSNGSASSGNLKYSGSGSLTLSGANTYSGTTTVNSGTLLVNNTTGSGTGSSAVTVNSTGTLGGTGTVSGTVDVKSGGKLSPGTSPGIFHTGALTLEASSTYVVDVNGGSGPTATGAGTLYDQTIVNGSISLAGNISLTLGITPLVVGDKFFIALSNGTVTGTFANTAGGGAIYTQGPDVFLVNYADSAGDGSNLDDISLTVTAVPEPSTWVGAALAMGAALLTQRRRFKRLLVES